MNLNSPRIARDWHISHVEHLIEPLRHSPCLHEAVVALQEQLKAEEHRRQAFYRDMTPEQKVEFIDGKVVMHSPAPKEHLVVTSNISRLLSVFVDVSGTGLVLTEKCLCVFPRNDYEPDIVFFGNEKAAQLDNKTLKFPVPDLAVEVLSASTEKNDRGVKFEDFAAHGVGEYWIVDADAGVVEQYVLDGESFTLRLKSDSGLLRSEAISGFTVAISAFFDADENLAALRELIVN